MEVGYKDLSKIAKTYRDLAQYYMMNGNWRPVYLTGNLYKSIGRYNTNKNMIISDIDPYIITLNFGPPTAQYGIFPHNGTSKMKSRPFAVAAANSPQLAEEINKLGLNITEQYFETYQEELDMYFRWMQQPL